MLVHPNIFRPRNDWNIISLNCKKLPSDSFVSQLTKIIWDELGVNPFEKTRYQGGRNVQARQLFFTFMVRHTNRSLRSIGEIFGKDHATVLHSVKSIGNMCDTDNRFKAMYDKMNSSILSIK